MKNVQHFGRNQLLHRARWISQLLRRPQTAIIGSYHYGNTGDMALADAIVAVARRRMRSPVGVQSIYGLQKWPAAKRAIIGGGAIGYESSLIQVVTRYREHPKNAAVLGVDFNESSYSANVIAFLRDCAWLSCRSLSQALHIAELTGRSDVRNHPDVAFALDVPFCSHVRKDKPAGRRLVGVNLTPLYGVLDGDRIIPDLAYIKERPELYSNVELMNSRFIHEIRALISRYLAQGFQVRTFPFASHDEPFMRYALHGLNIQHSSYNPNPRRMLEAMSLCSTMIATRFHPMIFALKLGLQIIPIAGARKNEELLAELKIDRCNFAAPQDFLTAADVRLCPLSVDSATIALLEEKATESIDACVSSLLV